MSINLFENEVKMGQYAYLNRFQGSSSSRTIAETIRDVFIYLFLFCLTPN